MECRTESGQVFEAPAAAASVFTMAVKGCGPTVGGRTVGQAAPAQGPTPLSPLLRLYEAPQAETRIPLKDSASGTAKLRPAPARMRLDRRRALPRGAVYGTALRRVAMAYDIDPAFLQAVIHIESGDNPLARSPKGALGLMQVAPSTARRFGLQAAALSDPAANLAAGAAYLKTLQRLYGDNLPLILAAYNAGEGAVARHGGRVPPYRETVSYVANVLGLYRSALYARGSTAEETVP